jgi:glyoxylase-like metal-dependent hydrolase (beta-lactamase superfamily II)
MTDRTGVGRLNEQSAVRALELGGVRLTYVVDGAMGLTPEGFFPGIPREHFSAHPETLDPHGLVAMSAGGLLVERDGRALLIDAGLGEARLTVIVDGVAVGPVDTGAFPETLAALGWEPSDIEVLAFTHLHADHTGWAFVPDEAGGYRKFLPNARYVVASTEWAPHARGEHIPGAPRRAVVIDPLADTHTPVDDGAEIFPGVHAVVTPGHSPGHTSYVISTPAGRVVVFGDAFHIPAQLAHPDWPSKPDIDAEAVLTARRRLLDELSRPGTIGFSCHFGDQAFGRVVTGGNGLPVWEPVPTTVIMPPPRQLRPARAHGQAVSRRDGTNGQ